MLQQNRKKCSSFSSSSRSANNYNNTLACHKSAIAKIRGKLTRERARKKLKLKNGSKSSDEKFGKDHIKVKNDDKMMGLNSIIRARRV
jgi:hypothetical protein